MFRPTISDDGMPTTCFCCGRLAQGMGIGDFRPDPKFVCIECLMIAEFIRKVRSFHPIEKAAVERTLDIIAPTIEANGTDFAEWTEEQVVAFVTQIVTGFGTSLRAVIADGEIPF